jgi:tRNA A37 threonylcarbamoyladenosine dehydratase
LAIVGLGGTGGYILDFVTKTHVREIHLFDGDVFSQHNAFRAPGAPALEDLTNPFKVDYFAAIYGQMRRGLVPHAIYITEDNVAQLADHDFVFVRLDNPVARKIIVTALQREWNKVLNDDLRNTFCRWFPGMMPDGQAPLKAAA